ncbi:Lrp/AsnC family transcriptional regulator, partial [Bacillus wiedmannii]
EELIDIVIPFGTVKTSMILSSPIPYRPIITD